MLRSITSYSHANINWAVPVKSVPVKSLKLYYTPAHNIALANHLCFKLRAIEREIYIKVHLVESPLRCENGLKIFLQVLS